jgi:hypothetical protein
MLCPRRTQNALSPSNRPVRFAVVAAKGFVLVSVLGKPKLLRNSVRFLSSCSLLGTPQNIEMYYHDKITPVIEFTPDVH